MKKLARLLRTSNSSNSIKEEERRRKGTFESFSCLSPELAWSLAHASYEDENIEVCLE